MKRITLLLAAIIVLLLSVACTQQERAKNFGGKATEKVAAGQKVVNVTWKDDHLWYLTRPMLATEQPETYSFKESSSWGVMQGEVIIIESR